MRACSAALRAGSAPCLVRLDLTPLDRMHILHKHKELLARFSRRQGVEVVLKGRTAIVPLWPRQRALTVLQTGDTSL